MQVSQGQMCVPIMHAILLVDIPLIPHDPGDRGQPACGWCVKNKQTCEYKERKKPGLRAGYGRELEARLGMQSCAMSNIASSIIAC